MSDFRNEEISSAVRAPDAKLSPAKLAPGVAYIKRYKLALWSMHTRRERALSPAAGAQTLNTPTAASTGPTKCREPYRGLCPDSLAVMARTRAAAVSADIV